VFGSGADKRGRLWQGADSWIKHGINSLIGSAFRKGTLPHRYFFIN
jgi:hypothetical protein